MILYKKTFPLAKGLTFSRYIKLLVEKSFSPYVLVFEKVSPDDYHAEMILADFVFLWHWHVGLREGVLLKAWKIQRGKDRQEITLEASPDGWDFLLILNKNRKVIR